VVRVDTCGVGEGSSACVGDLKMDIAVAVVDSDTGFGMVSMFYDIRQPFLHHPICGEIEPGGKVDGGAFDDEIDRLARGSQLVQQGLQLAQA